MYKNKNSLKNSYLNAKGVRISKATGMPVRTYSKTSDYWQDKDNDPLDVKPEMAEALSAYDEFRGLFDEQEVKTLIELKKSPKVIEMTDLAVGSDSSERSVGILVASDWHSDETVKPETVLNKNEFNLTIAESRIKHFFVNAQKVIRKKQVDELVFACLGDMIGGYIHDELAQTNGCTPMQGVHMVKKLIVSGIKFLVDELPNLDKITFIGICGNHSRTTKKMQFSNGYALSYEYFMYKDIEESCKSLGLDKVKFVIPESEFSYINVFDKKLLFCHGHQFKTAGGVGGIYPSMLRWFGKMNQTIRIDKAFIGHYHTSIYTKEVMVNGSIKGYDAFALGHGLPFEVPQQSYVILDEVRGFIFYTPIFVD